MPQLVVPDVMIAPWLVSVLPLPVADMPKAFMPLVVICPWFSTELLETTPMARTVECIMAPGNTVTLTLLLPAAAVIAVDEGVGLGGDVSQTTA
ncbi:MAG: hypothetical protein ABS58_09800 [Mesorhizobium sp. SCN 65-20]|nr:MAG: hypothetical protein ABS58_09800 [Mesorhizobium sp. SCN 65-20]